MRITGIRRAGPPCANFRTTVKTVGTGDSKRIAWDARVAHLGFIARAAATIRPGSTLFVSFDNALGANATVAEAAATAMIRIGAWLTSRHADGADTAQARAVAAFTAVGAGVAQRPTDADAFAAGTGTTVIPVLAGFTNDSAFDAYILNAYPGAALGILFAGFRILALTVGPGATYQADYEAPDAAQCPTSRRAGGNQPG